MKRLLLPIILLLIGLGGGVGAGLLVGGNDATASEVASAPDEEGDANGGDEDQDGAGEGSPPDEVQPPGEGTEYVRINNQFVVPIVRNGAVRSLVVLSLSLEVDLGESGAVFTYEPRLRDSFLRVLFAHANAGGFDGRFTEAEAMEPLRSALLEAAQGVLGRDAIYDVLITDILRQDA